MIVKNNTVLKEFDGKDIVVKEKPLLVKDVLINSISLQNQELQPTAEQAIRAYELGLKIMNEDEVELTAEDIVYIKARMLKLYTPLIFGQVVKLLEKND